MLVEGFFALFVSVMQPNSLADTIAASSSHKANVSAHIVDDFRLQENLKNMAAGNDKDLHVPRNLLKDNGRLQRYYEAVRQMGATAEDFLLQECNGGAIPSLRGDNKRERALEKSIPHMEKAAEKNFTKSGGKGTLDADTRCGVLSACYAAVYNLGDVPAPRESPLEREMKEHFKTMDAAKWVLMHDKGMTPAQLKDLKAEQVHDLLFEYWAEIDYDPDEQGHYPMPNLSEYVVSRMKGNELENELNRLLISHRINELILSSDIIANTKSKSTRVALVLTCYQALDFVPSYDLPKPPL
jgi:hypothetical protein